jgi:DNA repair protein RecN (Recombination protein N)
MNRLRRCTIEDFGLIRGAEVRFADGLSAFTGETGSGKTMVLGALKFVLGERASPDLVRSGAQRARVTLEFEPDAAARTLFANEGFELEPDEDAIVVRELAAGGKSSARVNGRAATSAQLRTIAETLVDFVGQHEHQRLLSAAYQGDVLDRYAGDDALALRERVTIGHTKLGALETALHELETNAGRFEAEAEDARFALGEIDAARLSDDDEETGLRERRDYLANAERIAFALRTARDALSERDGAAVETLGAAAAALNGVADYGQELARLGASLAAMQSDAGEIAVAVARELDRAEYDPAEAETIGQRLDVLDRLKRRHGGSIGAVLAARERLAEQLDAVDNRDERLAALRAERATVGAGLAADAARLTAVRAAAARAFEGAVNAELPALALRGARFAVPFETLASPGPRGAETASFAFSANAGEPLRPLARVASGGELSRVLLAVVVALADKRDASTLVFDEIDAGIGGAAAQAVAARLGALAAATQVVCVTHLAQIAAWADRQFTLRKAEARGATRIEVVELDRAADVRSELARMLSGSATRAALDHADQLAADVRAQRRRPLRSA